MKFAMKLPLAVTALTFGFTFALATQARAAMPAAATRSGFMLAQAMVPPTGMMDTEHPMPMNERYLRRFPQSVRVGDLIGLPVLDLKASTLGYIRQVVRTPQGKIELIVSYSRWWGWFGRPVAVPIEAVGIEGRQLVSLDMPRSEYISALTWRNVDARPLPAGAKIMIALARN
jgi:PRC-barrel domain